MNYFIKALGINNTELFDDNHDGLQQRYSQAMDVKEVLLFILLLSDVVYYIVAT